MAISCASFPHRFHWKKCKSWIIRKKKARKVCVIHKHSAHELSVSELTTTERVMTQVRIYIDSLRACATIISFLADLAHTVHEELKKNRKLYPTHRSRVDSIFACRRTALRHRPVRNIISSSCSFALFSAASLRQSLQAQCELYMHSVCTLHAQCELSQLKN
jgi:hypothetical protein